jgi:hypothetical protein
MSDQQLPNFKVHLNYPNNEEYDYFTKLERIDLDFECEKDLSNNHAVRILEPQSINKAIRSDTSIFSSKFGKKFSDMISSVMNCVSRPSWWL